MANNIKESDSAQPHFILLLHSTQSLTYTLLALKSTTMAGTQLTPEDLKKIKASLDQATKQLELMGAQQDELIKNATIKMDDLCCMQLLVEEANKIGNHTLQTPDIQAIGGTADQKKQAETLTTDINRHFKEVPKVANRWPSLLDSAVNVATTLKQWGEQLAALWDPLTTALKEKQVWKALLNLNFVIGRDIDAKVSTGTCCLT